MFWFLYIISKEGLAQTKRSGTNQTEQFVLHDEGRL